MSPFVVPQPAHMEHHEQWLRRIARAFEEWANQPVRFTVSRELAQAAIAAGRDLSIEVSGPTHIVVGLAEREEKAREHNDGHR